MCTTTKNANGNQRGELRNNTNWQANIISKVKFNVFVIDVTEFEKKYYTKFLVSLFICALYFKSYKY